METPVYLMTGFLDSGKTRFLQETLADKKFFENKKDITLVLQCEAGEEELDPSGFAGQNVYCEYIDSERKINKDKLSALQGKYNATRVLVEYNGMWNIGDLVNALPDGWFILQEMTFADASTYEVFNANMRNLTVDKLQNTDLIVFNRCEEDTDYTALHKIVRGISRKADIVYERTDGQLSYDEIEDPLPFDKESDIIDISDRDYALFYRDLSEDIESYDGKTVKFLGVVKRNGKLPKSGFVIGRPVMTCCVADIAFSGLYCEDGGEKVETEQWIVLTAKISIKYSGVYGSKGPVLNSIDIKPAAEPENPVATFY